MSKLNKTITKDLLLETLSKQFTVGATCKKLNISRQTYYRWLEQFRLDDKNVDKDVQKALASGVQEVNDLAEQKLVEKIIKGDMSAIKFWLSRRHDDFKQAYIVQN